MEKAQHEYCQEAIKRKDHIESQYWILAEMLYRIKNESRYLSGWESWNEYCMEFGMSQSSIDRLVKVHQVFRVDADISVKELKEVKGWAILSEALPAIHNSKDARKWLEKSKVLTLKDMRDEVKESRTGILQTSCIHPNAYVIRICPDCGERTRIYDDV